MRKIGCKLVQNQRRYCRRSRLSFRMGHSPKTGKDRSGDKPKPEPHPIDPGKQHLYMIWTRPWLKRRRSRSVDICADAGSWCFLERAQGRHGKRLQDTIVLCHSQIRSSRRRSIVAVLGQDRNGCVGFYDFACWWFSKREIWQDVCFGFGSGANWFDESHWSEIRGSSQMKIVQDHHGTSPILRNGNHGNE